MRIAIISPFLWRYSRGIERYSVDLGNALAEQGHQVYLLTRKDGGEWRWGRLNSQVHLYNIALPRYFQSFFSTIQYCMILRKMKPDIAIVNFTWHGEETAYRLGAFRNAGVYLVLHYPASQVPHRYDMLIKSRLRKSATLIGVSNLVLEDAQQYFQQSVVVIANGTDIHRFRPAVNMEERDKLRDEYGIPRDCLVFLTVAAFEERKNIHLALNSMPAVIKKWPKAIYLIAGDGPKRESLIEQVDKLGLTKNVRFLGAVKAIEQVYRLSDLFLFLSTGEASPLALLEAMASGLPVVAARKPPLTEFSAAGGIQYVNERNNKEIENAIIASCENGYRQKAGADNRRYAETFHGWKQTAQKYASIFSRAA